MLVLYPVHDSAYPPYFHTRIRWSGACSNPSCEDTLRRNNDALLENGPAIACRLVLHDPAAQQAIARRPALVGETLEWSPFDARRHRRECAAAGRGCRLGTLHRNRSITSSE